MSTAMLIEGDDRIAQLDYMMDVEDGDVDVDALFDTYWQDETLELVARVDHWIGWIRECEARSAVRREEANRLLALSRVDDNRVTRLKERLEHVMRASGNLKLDTQRFRAWIQKNGGKAPLLVHEEDVPLDWCRMNPVPDKERIRAALEAGETLGFASIGERGESLRIK